MINNKSLVFIIILLIIILIISITGIDFISFINSNIGKIILENLYKYSGYNSLGILSSLPSVIKFNTCAHREDFKKVLNLTEEEINYIENAVK